HIYGLLDAEFLAAQQQLQHYSDGQLAKFKALLAAMQVPACGLVVHDQTGAPAASALMALADGIVIAGNVVTDPSQRLRGYATALMRTGHGWAHEAGAEIAALNVAAANS